MKPILAALIGVLIGLALLSAGARAYESHDAPATYVYADALLRQAIDVADQRWAARGQPLPCPAEVQVYDAPLGVLAHAPDSCTVGFDRAFRDSVWRTANDVHEFLEVRRHGLAFLCAVAVHERGHNLGYGHIPGTIMAAVVTIIPRECKAWSQQLLKPRHGQTTLLLSRTT
jgi:hypothetical protein